MDDKFKKMMKLLRSQNPSELQVQKWKNAVVGNEKPRVLPRQRTFYWGQMVAAASIGIFIGGILFGDLGLGESTENQEVAYEDATIEVVYTKL